MPGLRDYEVSLLKLVEKITNGSKIVINETGTTVTFTPGQLTGGKMSHDCSPDRSVVYYLEVAACLAPFCKDALILQLKGNTHDENDNSVDVFRSVTIPLLQKLGVGNDEFTNLTFKIVTRGTGPEPSGCVIFTCPTVRHIAPIDLSEEGLVKRVRGVFWSLQMNREFSNRFVESARGVLNNCLEDVWVYCEHVKEPSKRALPCYGASLMSETETGLFKGVCGIEADPEKADKLGKALAKKLLHEISQDGIVDEFHQWMAVLFMALTQDHKVSSCVIGSELSALTIEFLRMIEKFLLVKFKVHRREPTEASTQEESDEEEEPSAKKIQRPKQPIVMECIGINYTNTARRTGI